MARVQLTLSDEDFYRFMNQARKEGLALSTWLRVAANEHFTRKTQFNPFESEAELV